ncbi:MAG TPA: serine/threonine-protein kinase, partial [Caulobacteraceae bacterium]
MGGDPKNPADADRTVYSPRSKPAAPSDGDPPAAAPETAPDTAGETVFAPISHRPATGFSSEGLPPSAPADPPGGPALPPGGSAMRYGSAQVEIGMILNGIYAVKRLIGRGGMGEVYEGVNVNDAEDRVAIKVILPNLAADPNVQAMFFKEARALRTLSHPAVVQYRVVAQEPSIGIFYIVTEFIDGPSLSELLGKTTLTSAQLRSLLRRLAEGLRAAHELGAVHRDISPDNVLLPAGVLTSAKVIDFGIAKDLDTSKRTIIGDGFAGKLGYVAPEQLGDFGRDIGAWTDVYSLGLVMLSLIHGRNVDMGATLVDAVDRRRAGIDLGLVPPDLKPVLQAMLEVNPAQRLRSMDAVLAALDGGVAVQGPKAPVKGGGRPPPALLIGGVAALVIAVAGLAFLLGKPTKPAQSAAAVA